MESESSLPHSQVPAYVRILSQINPAQTHTSHLMKIRLYIILPFIQIKAAVVQLVEALQYKPEGRGFDFRW
jgi:2-keto-3-deoxy-L-rhamnonate aldolase RhmA